MRRVLASVAVVLVGLAAVAATDDDLFEIRKNFALFGRIYETLASEYVDPVGAEPLMRTGLAAMTDALDPYTVFFDEATAAEGRLQQGQDVGGVGAVVQARGGALTVVAVADGSSAETQGLRPGDTVDTLAGRPAAGLTPETAAALLRGQPGSTVERTVRRDGEPEPLRFVLVRAEATRAVVSFAGYVGDPADGVGFVRLETFLGEATREITEAVAQLRTEGTLRALVLDLRGNPGGLLNEAVGVSGLFLPQGTLVTATRGRAEGTSSTYVTPDAPIAPDLPVAVLVDEHSASASEIVAGALQDHDRGVIVGATTFGKGLVQVVRPMPYGTALKLTVSRYTTPAGREIQRLAYAQGARAAAVPDSLRRAFQTVGGRPVRSGGGIEPDVPVALGDESDLEAALVRSAAFTRFANRYRTENATLPAGFRVDASLLTAFRRFVEAENVTYRTASERAADALATELDAAGYGATSELTALGRAVEREKARDFERHADRLADQLRQEILSRYVGQRAQTTAALADDRTLAAARTLVLDRRQYDRTLGR